MPEQYYRGLSKCSLQKDWRGDLVHASHQHLGAAIHTTTVEARNRCKCGHYLCHITDRLRRRAARETELKAPTTCRSGSYPHNSLADRGVHPGSCDPAVVDGACEVLLSCPPAAAPRGAVSATTAKVRMTDGCLIWQTSQLRSSASPGTRLCLHAGLRPHR